MLKAHDSILVPENLRGEQHQMLISNKINKASVDLYAVSGCRFPKREETRTFSLCHKG